MSMLYLEMTKKEFFGHNQSYSEKGKNDHFTSFSNACCKISNTKF